MKNFFTTILLLAACATFAQTNLFVNPNFDADISGWTTQAGFSGAMNTFAFNAGNVSFPEEPASTSGSLEMVVNVISNPVNTGASSIRQTFDLTTELEPTGVTTFSGVIWVSSDVGGTDTLMIQVFSQNPGFVGLAFPQSDFTADGTFQKVTFTFDVDVDNLPADFDTTSVNVLFGLPDTTGMFRFDRATLIKGTPVEADALSTGDFAANDVSVYPIPASEVVNINGDISGNTVSIYDISGALVGSRAITGDFNSVDVSTLAAGVYFLQLDNGSTLKVVKG